DVAWPRSDLNWTCWEPKDLRGVPRAITDTRVFLDTTPLAGAADAHEAHVSAQFVVPTGGSKVRRAITILRALLECETDEWSRPLGPATWDCGPRVNLHGSVWLPDLYAGHVRAAPGSWPQRGTVVEQASVVLRVTSEFLYDSPAPVPVPTGAPAARISLPPVVWRFTRDQLSEHLRELANFIRMVLLASCLRHLRQLAFPA